MAGGCPRDASGAGPGAKVEGFDRVAGDSARREVFEVDSVEMRGSGDSGFVEGGEKSVSGESTTAKEVILIVEVETDSGGLLLVGLTADGSTVAAESVKVGIERLRRAGIVDTTVTRRSRLAAAVQMSLG